LACADRQLPHFHLWSTSPQSHPGCYGRPPPQCPDHGPAPHSTAPLHHHQRHQLLHAAIATTPHQSNRPLQQSPDHQHLRLAHLWLAPRPASGGRDVRLHLHPLPPRVSTPPPVLPALRQPNRLHRHPPSPR